MPQYLFRGHETIAAHIAHCLDPLGWKAVEDAAMADIAFTYCTSLSALEDAYFDDDGLVKRARPGTLLVDLSAATPSLARELSAVATVNDLRPVEAPISIIDPSQQDAFGSSDNIMCFVAGENDDIDEVVDVLETIAGTVERTGTCGTAQLAKASRTIQATALIAAAVEADALARATGNVGIVDAMQSSAKPLSPAAAPLLSAAATDSFEGTYTVEMLMSEVAAACSAAEDANLIVPQLESVMHLLEVIAVIGGADKAPAALSLIYREEADSAAHGLDWTRAEGLFSEHVDHDHVHEYGDDDESGFYGGFGGYSAN